MIQSGFDVSAAERIPTRRIPEITDEPLIWRYFGFPLPKMLEKTGLDANRSSLP